MLEAAVARSAEFISDAQQALDYFLSQTDSGEVLLLDASDNQARFRLVARNPEHLPLIQNALAQDQGVRKALDIDSHDLRIEGNALLIVVRKPDDSVTSW
jgi:hypothetical protein